MKPADVLRVLQVAAHYDPAMLPRDDEAKKAKAQEWSVTLPQPLTRDYGIACVRDHYSSSRSQQRLMPSHFIEWWNSHDDSVGSRHRALVSESSDGGLLVWCPCGWEMNVNSHDDASRAAGEHGKGANA